MHNDSSAGPSLGFAFLVLAVLALGFGCLSISFYPDPLRFIWNILFLSGVLFFFSTGLIGWGVLILRVLKMPSPLDLISCWAAGAVGTATLTGLVGRIYFPGLWAVLIFITAGIVITVYFRSLLELPLPPGRPGGYALGAGIFMIPPFLLALAPPISLDSLVYHLAVPHQALIRGALTELPANVHSYFPLHSEMLYGLLLSFPEGGQLTQMLHLLAGFLSLVVIYRIGKRLSGGGSLFPVLGLVSLPVLNVVMGWAWNEWFLILYMLLGLEWGLWSGETEPGVTPLPAWIFISAAATVKYYALPLLLLIPLRGHGKRTLAAGFLLFILIASPWYGKNLLLTGNPLYPLFEPDTSASILTQYRGESGGFPLSGYLGRKDLLDESVGVLFPVLLFMALFSCRSYRKAMLLPGIVTLVYLGGGFFFHPTVRYFTPVFVLASLFGGLSLERLRGASRFRFPVDVLVVLLLCVNLVHVMKIYSFYQPSAPALGMESPGHFLQEGQNYYDAFSRINLAAQNSAGRDVRVLVVGESRIFYLECPAVAGSYLDPPPYRKYLGDPPSPDTLAENLRREGITFIYLNEAQYRPGETVTSYSNELIFQAGPQEDAVFRSMLRQYGILVYKSGPISVYGISESPRNPSEDGQTGT